MLPIFALPDIFAVFTFAPFADINPFPYSEMLLPVPISIFPVTFALPGVVIFLLVNKFAFKLPSVVILPAFKFAVIFALPDRLASVAANVAALTSPVVVRFPTLALPSTFKIPLAIKLAPAKLPDTLTCAPLMLVVVMLPTDAFPTTVNIPCVDKLAPETFPNAEITPNEITLPA